MMRKILIILFIGIFLYNCSNSEQKQISIIVSKDTVKIDEVFKAKIFVPFYNKYLPMVYIITKNDTIPIPYYQDLKCAVFQSSGKSVGPRQYKGFVEYYDQNENLKRENFIIKYYITSDLPPN